MTNNEAVKTVINNENSDIKLWIYDPWTLLHNLFDRNTYIPDSQSTDIERINAFTRIVIVITIIYIISTDSIDLLYLILLIFIAVFIWSWTQNKKKPLMDDIVNDVDISTSQTCIAKDAYIDFQDMYDKQNYKRHFINVKTGNDIDDRRKFTNFLYGNMNDMSCKNNMQQCTSNDDLRYESER